MIAVIPVTRALYWKIRHFFLLTILKSRYLWLEQTRRHTYSKAGLFQSLNNWMSWSVSKCKGYQFGVLERNAGPVDSRGQVGFWYPHRVWKWI